MLDPELRDHPLIGNVSGLYQGNDYSLDFNDFFNPAVQEFSDKVNANLARIRDEIATRNFEEIEALAKAAKEEKARREELSLDRADASAAQRRADADARATPMEYHGTLSFDDFLRRGQFPKLCNMPWNEAMQDAIDEYVRDVIKIGDIIEFSTVHPPFNLERWQASGGIPDFYLWREKQVPVTTVAIPTFRAYKKGIHLRATTADIMYSNTVGTTAIPLGLTTFRGNPLRSVTLSHGFASRFQGSNESGCTVRIDIMPGTELYYINRYQTGSELEIVLHLGHVYVLPRTLVKEGREGAPFPPIGYNDDCHQSEGRQNLILYYFIVSPTKKVVYTPEEGSRIDLATVSGGGFGAAKYLGYGKVFKLIDSHVVRGFQKLNMIRRNHTLRLKKKYTQSRPWLKLRALTPAKLRMHKYRASRFQKHPL